MESIFCTECGARNPLTPDGTPADGPRATPTCAACGAQLELEASAAGSAHPEAAPTSAPNAQAEQAPGDAQASEASASEEQSLRVIQAALETQATEAQPTDAQPADVRAREADSAEAQPAEALMPEVPPAEVRANEVQPSEAQPAGSHTPEPAGSQTALAPATEQPIEALSAAARESAGDTPPPAAEPGEPAEPAAPSPEAQSGAIETLVASAHLDVEASARELEVAPKALVTAEANTLPAVEPAIASAPSSIPSPSESADNHASPARQDPEIEVAAGLSPEEAADPLLVAAIAAYTGSARQNVQAPTPPQEIGAASADAQRNTETQNADTVSTALLMAAPLEAAPLEAAPLEAAPLEAAPLEAAPLEAAPLEAAPLEAAPLEAAPLEASPANLLPASSTDSVESPARSREPTSTDAPVVSNAYDDASIRRTGGRPSAVVLGAAGLAVIGAFFLGRGTAPQSSDTQTKCPPVAESLSASSQPTPSLGPAGSAAFAAAPNASSPASPTREAPLAVGRMPVQTRAAFDTKAANRALKQAASRAVRCRRAGEPHGSAVVTVTFANSGRAASANVTGAPYAGTPTAACIGALLRGARVPAFVGDPVTVKKTLAL